MGRAQGAEPFFATMLLGWTWTPLHSARTYTSEEDLLAELLGREQARAVVTERPWVRVDVQLHATSRTSDVDEVPLEGGAATQLERLAQDAGAALAAWMRSLALLTG